MTTIPILEPSITELEMELVVECLNSGWISSRGNFVKKSLKIIFKVGL